LYNFLKLDTRSQPLKAAMDCHAFSSKAYQQKLPYDATHLLQFHTFHFLLAIFNVIKLLQFVCKIYFCNLEIKDQLKIIYKYYIDIYPNSLFKLNII